MGTTTSRNLRDYSKGIFTRKLKAGSMQLALTENAWWGTSVDRVEGIKIAHDVGFDSYAIFTQDVQGRSFTPEVKKRMRDTMKDLGFPCASFCVILNSLVDWNEDIRKTTIAWVKDQIDTGYDFGSKKMIGVPTEYLWEKTEVKPEVQWNYAVEAMREIGDHAKTLGIEIGLESEPYKNNLLNNIETQVKFLDAVGHPSVKANVDFVHMHVVHDPPSTMEKLGKRIINIHFADTNGPDHAHFPPGSGIVPLKEDLQVLKKIGSNASIGVEIENLPEPQRIHEWVKQAYEGSAKLMDEVGVRG